MKAINHVKVEIVRENRGLYETNKISSPSNAARIAKDFIGNADREHCIVLCLDSTNKVNAIHTLAIGSISAAIVHPREVMKVAILANSRSIILAHNHPSGDVTPSKDDIELTSRLKEAGEIMGIDFMDHIIVNDADDTFYSMIAIQGKDTIWK